MPERVQVIYFPKRARDPRRTTQETPAPEPSDTLEFRPAHPEQETVGESPEAPVKKGRRRPTLELDPDPALRYHMQKLEEMLDSGSPAERLRGMSRRELAEIAMFGHQLFEAGRLDEARVVFEGLVGLDLEDAFPHTMLGTVFLAMGAQDRAIALFEAALSIDPDDLAARVYRAEIRINQGKLQPAKAELERVLRDGPVDDAFVERARRLKKIVADRQRRRR